MHRVIEAVGRGPVDLVASSGGAVNALELVAQHPDDVRTLVAHEPPLAALVEDREAALAACQDIHDTYLRDGMGTAMAKFIAIVSHRGPVPADFAEQPVDPSVFGLPTEDDGTPRRRAAGPEPAVLHEPRARPRRRRGRVHAGRGRRRRGVGRASSPVAAARRWRRGSASRSTVFPGDHAGFLGGEYGQTGAPDAFAARLREVLGG